MYSPDVGSDPDVAGAAMPNLSKILQGGLAQGGACHTHDNMLIEFNFWLAGRLEISWRVSIDPFVCSFHPNIAHKFVLKHDHH